MTQVTIQLNDHLQKLAECQAAAQGTDANDYLGLLLQDAIETAEINKKLKEADDEIDRGEYTIWQPGYFAKRVRELIRQRRESTCSK